MHARSSHGGRDGGKGPGEFVLRGKPSWALDLLLKIMPDLTFQKFVVDTGSRCILWERSASCALSIFKGYAESYENANTPGNFEEMAGGCCEPRGRGNSTVLANRSVITSKPNAESAFYTCFYPLTDFWYVDCGTVNWLCSNQTF